MLFSSVLALLSASLLFQSPLAQGFPLETDTSCSVKPGSGAPHQVPPNEVVASITTITKISATLNTSLGGLSFTNPIAIINIGTTFVKGISTIAADVTNAATMLNGAVPLGDAAAGAVVEALVSFVKVHQALLATVIGKHGFFAQCGFTAPIAAALRIVEGVVDTFALVIIKFIPTRSMSAQTSIASLQASIQTSIKVYSA